MVVLICISLMTVDVKYLFLCLLAICTSSLQKYVFRSFAFILIGFCVFCCLLTCKWSLYILDSKLLSDT